MYGRQSQYICPLYYIKQTVSFPIDSDPCGSVTPYFYSVENPESELNTFQNHVSYLHCLTAGLICPQLNKSWIYCQAEHIQVIATAVRIVYDMPQRTVHITSLP